MKKFLLICCCFFTLLVSAQQINEPFGFPLKPGSKEWPNLKTEKEKFNAMQIPKDMLSNMTTYALTVSCLNYPSYIVYLTSFDIQTGYSVLAVNFNGLSEYIRRPDAAKCLIDIYKIAGEKGFLDQHPHLDELYWTFKISWMEIILAQDELIYTLDNEEKNKLLILAKEKLTMKASSNDYSGYDLMVTTFLMGRVLHSLNYKEFESDFSGNASLRNFLINPQFANGQALERIYQLTVKYLEHK